MLVAVSREVGASNSGLERGYSDARDYSVVGLVCALTIAAYALGVAHGSLAALSERQRTLEEQLTHWWFDYGTLSWQYVPLVVDSDCSSSQMRGVFNGWSWPFACCAIASTGLAARAGGLSTRINEVGLRVAAWGRRFSRGVGCWLVGISDESATPPSGVNVGTGVVRDSSAGETAEATGFRADAAAFVPLSAQPVFVTFESDTGGSALAGSTTGALRTAAATTADRRRPA